MKSKWYGLCQTQTCEKCSSPASTDSFSSFNIGLNYLCPLRRNTAFVILPFWGEEQDLFCTKKVTESNAQTCHRYVYQRHLPPGFHDHLSPLLPVTDFFFFLATQTSINPIMRISIHDVQKWFWGQLSLDIDFSFMRPAFGSFCRQCKAF